MYCQSFQMCSIMEVEMIILSKPQICISKAGGKVYASRVPAGQWLGWEAEVGW